ncbi:TetR family transcriptional regulator [Novosphingobium sp.]|uniref:TetR family transcriptional regulator n=1 Tax=Novosphingobium sp. TaxID=1874826 RepID=UPI0035B1D16F
MPPAAQTSASKPARNRAAGYNHYGQKIGSKGERTRQALIDTTIELLGTQGLRDVSVADVARGAQTSPATFYVYFRGVPEVVLAALEDAPQTSPELEALMAQDWQAPGALERARAFVDAYCELWNRHGVVFRVRNLAAEEGDERFYKARMTAAMPMMTALTAQIERAQAAGAIPADLRPRACAGTILMMLERLSAIGPMSRDDDTDIAFGPLKAAAAFTLANMLGGRA